MEPALHLYEQGDSATAAVCKCGKWADDAVAHVRCTCGQSPQTPSHHIGDCAYARRPAPEKAPDAAEVARKLNEEWCPHLTVPGIAGTTRRIRASNCDQCLAEALRAYARDEFKKLAEEIRARIAWHEEHLTKVMASETFTEDYRHDVKREMEPFIGGLRSAAELADRAAEGWSCPLRCGHPRVDHICTSPSCKRGGCHGHDGSDGPCDCTHVERAAGKEGR